MTISTTDIQLRTPERLGLTHAQVDALFIAASQAVA